MKICILSRNPSLYSTRRLVQEGEARGHQVIVVDPLRCYMNISAQKPGVFFKQTELNDVDAVIPRIGASVTFYATAVLRQFEMMGVYCLNESVAISRSRDKLRAMQLLSRKGIDMPQTAIAHSSKMKKEIINVVGGAPLVIKLIEGTQGQGVILADTNSAAESLIEAFRKLDAYFLVQEFIKEADGADLRVFIVGGKVVATMMRKAKPGEFRANLHLGGASSAVELTPQEMEVAVHAADVIGLNVAGVDILRSRRGPLVLEVNSSPGLEGIEKASQVNVSTKIIEYIEKNLVKNQNQTRGRG